MYSYLIPISPVHLPLAIDSLDSLLLPVISLVQHPSVLTQQLPLNRSLEILEENLGVGGVGGEEEEGKNRRSVGVGVREGEELR